MKVLKPGAGPDWFTVWLSSLQNQQYLDCGMRDIWAMTYYLGTKNKST